MIIYKPYIYPHKSIRAKIPDSDTKSVVFDLFSIILEDINDERVISKLYEHFYLYGRDVVVVTKSYIEKLGETIYAYIVFEKISQPLYHLSQTGRGELIMVGEIMIADELDHKLALPEMITMNSHVILDTEDNSEEH